MKDLETKKAQSVARQRWVGVDSPEVRAWKLKAYESHNRIIKKWKARQAKQQEYNKA